MIRHKTLSWTVAALVGALPLGAFGQDDDVLFEKKPPRRHRDHPPDPERVREHLERLRKNNPDDPRIERMERFLARLESGEFSDMRRGDRPGPKFSREEVEAFLDDHPRLREIANRVKRKPRGAHRHLFKIMDAFNRGDEQLGELMIERVDISVQVRMLAAELRRADVTVEDERHGELVALVRQQLDIEHRIKGLELERLAQRLADEQARHAEQAGKLDELAARRARRILSGERRPGDGPPDGKRRRRGKRGGPPIE